MTRPKVLRDRRSISAKIRMLIVQLALPLCVLAFFVLLMFFLYSLQYA